MHTPFLHDQILAAFEGVTLELREIYAEELVSLLVNVLQTLVDSHNYSVWQVVEDLSEAVTSLFGFHLHEKKLGDDAADGVAREEKNDDPLGHCDYRPPFVTVQNVYEGSFDSEGEGCQGENAEVIVHKGSQKDAGAKKYVDYLLPLVQDDFQILDLLLDRHVAHFFADERRVVKVAKQYA